MTATKHSKWEIGLVCPECHTLVARGTPIAPKRVCPGCGIYGGHEWPRRGYRAKYSLRARILGIPLWRFDGYEVRKD